MFNVVSFSNKIKQIGKKLNNKNSKIHKNGPIFDIDDSFPTSFNAFLNSNVQKKSLPNSSFCLREMFVEIWFFQFFLKLNNQFNNMFW